MTRTVLDARQSSGFPGNGEGAPLDLDGAGDLSGLVARFRDGSIDALGRYGRGAPLRPAGPPRRVLGHGGPHHR